MKLILSRKGFDAASGEGPSPILPDGRLAPLPIPDGRSPVRYADVRVGGVPATELLEALYPRRRWVRETAHLDPDLDPAALSRRPAGWRPLFGQSGAAQAHLARHRVGPGDVFLFFGWFRETEVRSGRLRWRAGAPDLHLLSGWLRVGSLHRVTPRAARELPFAARHPHLSGERGPGNTLYRAAPRLRLPGSGLALPGGAWFPRLRPGLRLTAPGAGGRSRWRLPRWLHPRGRRSTLSYHADRRRWRLVPQGVELASVARGQEFVLDGEHYPEAASWLAELLGAGSALATRRSRRSA